MARATSTPRLTFGAATYRRRATTSGAAFWTTWLPQAGSAAPPVLEPDRRIGKTSPGPLQAARAGLQRWGVSSSDHAPRYKLDSGGGHFRLAASVNACAAAQAAALEPGGDVAAAVAPAPAAFLSRRVPSEGAGPLRRDIAAPQLERWDSAKTTHGARSTARSSAAFAPQSRTCEFAARLGGRRKWSAHQVAWERMKPFRMSTSSGG